MMAQPIEDYRHTGNAQDFRPTSDVQDRHRNGITKNRRASASTGGGRAWSEEEEVYLLQTRLQKMPYKHIASYLKKTELACRLHYHQLTHGSGRRRRVASVSESNDPNDPSPVRGYSPDDDSPTLTVVSSEPDSPSYAGPVLPRITTPFNASSGLPVILPKPSSMALPSRYPTPFQQETTQSLEPSPFPQPSRDSEVPVLRLDCSLPSLPPPSQIDMHRLQSIYAAHRQSFWGHIASEYGPGVSPTMLEQAWKTSAVGAAGQTPITPATSPNDREGPWDSQEHRNKRIRISAILGIDANPRSPTERELVRRLEEQRDGEQRSNNSS